MRRLDPFLRYKTISFAKRARGDPDDEENAPKRQAVSYTKLEPIERIEPPAHEYEYCDGHFLSGLFQRKRPMVYVGERLSSHMPVVIKSNHICNVANESVAESTIREIEILRHLSALQNARRLVSYIDSFRCNQYLYLVMTRAPGADLFTLLAPPGCKNCIEHHPDRVTISRQLVQTVDYLHKRGIAHFDIKCENIVYDVESKHLTLIDFGGSRQLPENGLVPWHCFGTRATRAPEICDGRNHSPTIAARPVDIWAVGIILVILNITSGLEHVYNRNSLPFCYQGLLPFNDGPSVVAQTLRSMSMPDECAVVCARMLLVDPADRITTTEIMNSSWWLSTEA